MKCKSCKARDAKPGRATCQRCIDRAIERKWKWLAANPKEKRPRAPSARSEYRKARYVAARAAGICSSCRRCPAVRGTSRCATCAERLKTANRNRRNGQSVVFDRVEFIPDLNYTPIDEWLANPVNRILRALKRLGWATLDEIATVLDEPSWDADRAARNRLQQNAARAFKRGLLERRPSAIRSREFEYRLAANVSADPPFDAEVIDDGYREAA